jgi:hypothetical protein
MYQRQQNNEMGSNMPLIMYHTPFNRIEEGNYEPFIYDDRKQVVVYDMRVIGTNSLKTSNTKKGTIFVFDKKNAIDDKKNVK